MKIVFTNGVFDLLHAGHVRDVCGAGDTVLAAIGVAMADGKSLYNACSFASVSAAHQVTFFGISPVADHAIHGEGLRQSGT